MAINADGKIVAEFLYTVKTRKKGTEIRIPVRLVQDVQRDKIRTAETQAAGKHFGMPGHTKAATFRVKIDEPKKIDITCSDIELLRRLVFAEFDKAYSLTWVNYFLVKVMRESIYSGVGMGLSISYVEYQLATLEDGSVVHRSYSRYSGSEVHEGRPWTGTNSREETISLVLDTPANEKALKDFCKRLNEVRERIADFLSPDVIADNLLSLQRLLPAPEKEP